MIQEAIQSAESVVAQLTAQRDAALKAAQEASHATPVNPAAELICEQGEGAFEAGDLSKASTLFESALLIDAGCVRALSNLAVVATHQEQPWQALSYLLLALVRDHEDQGVVENLQGLLEVYPELQVARSLFV
jgi:lipopolysaccharide biosynthesis regulator YciM